MQGFVVRMLISALGLWLASEIVPGFAFTGFGTLLAAALLLGVILCFAVQFRSELRVHDVTLFCTALPNGHAKKIRGRLHILALDAQLSVGRLILSAA